MDFNLMLKFPYLAGYPVKFPAKLLAGQINIRCNSKTDKPVIRGAKLQKKCLFLCFLRGVYTFMTFS